MLTPSESLSEYYGSQLSACPNLRVMLFQVETHVQAWEPRSCKNHRCPHCGLVWLRKEKAHLLEVTKGLRMWRRDLDLGCDWKSFSKKLRAKKAHYLGFKTHDRLVVLSTVPTSSFLWVEVDDVAAEIEMLLGLHLGKKILRSHEWAISHSPAEPALDEEGPRFRKIRMYVKGGIRSHRQACSERRVQIERKRDVTYLAVDKRLAWVDRTKGDEGKDYLFAIGTPEYGTPEWKEFSLSLGTREERPVAPARNRLWRVA